MKIAINGALGRMGRMVLEVAASQPDLEVAALVDAPGKAGEAIPTPWGPLAVLGAPEDVGDVDVGIDFSVPEATVAFVRSLAGRGIPVVAGTTGLTPEQLDLLRKAASAAPVVSAPNTSLGVYCLHELAAMAQAILGPSYDVEILEVHHRHKRDAPSGTALSVASRLAGAGLTPVLARQGETGPRQPGEMGVMALRGGEVVGEHTVYFLGDHDRIEITHRATSRAVLAQGAIGLARRLVRQSPGFYGPAELLRPSSSPSS